MKKCLLTIAMALICSMAGAQMAQFQALYIYNFAKNISWPAEDASKDLVITVIGDNELGSELTKLAKTKGVGNRKVVINQVATVSNLPQSDIIFLGESKSNLVANLTSSQDGKKTLIVCGKKGLCANGAGIAFVSEGGKLNFEISNNNIKKQGLTVSAKLISLGTSVD